MQYFGGLGIYQHLVDFAGAGATVPLTGFGNLLAKGAAPKDVQELLGHSDVNLTLNVYAHSARESKRNSAKLLDTLEAV